MSMVQFFKGGFLKNIPPPIVIGLRQVEGKTMGKKRREKSSDKREGGGALHVEREMKKGKRRDGKEKGKRRDEKGEWKRKGEEER